jgi:O-antigen/teichoic acid export membrane protein
MRLRTLRRRAFATFGVYGAALLGMLASIVAARELSKHDFARFAIVFATVSLLQAFLDLTIEEVVVKYGNRYSARGDWGRFRRLLEIGFGIKLLGGALGTLAVVGAAFLAPVLWKTHGVRGPLLIASLVPFIQAPEGMSSAILLIRNRYDVRGFFLFFSMAARFAAIVVSVHWGVEAVFVAIVLAQVLATGAISLAGILAMRHWPRPAAVPFGEERRAIIGFAAQSSVSSGLLSLRSLLPMVIVGGVTSSSQTADFRAAQAPQTAFASLSAPARLVLLAEQTRDVEAGRHWRAWQLLHRYIGGTIALAAVAVPVGWVLMPTLVRLVYGSKYLGAVPAVRLMLLAAAVQLVFGWTKSFPVSIGRPDLRTYGQFTELAVLIPGVAVLGWQYGASGAAGGVLAGAVALGAYWTIALLWLRAHPLSIHQREATA